jgi:hypothetical protein
MISQPKVGWWIIGFLYHHGAIVAMRGVHVHVSMGLDESEEH